jgi:hypothetical protein
MADGYRFDGVARAERYFVNTLLSHLLMANNFAGLRSLFCHVFGEGICLGLADDFEVVSEVDPLRDGSVDHPVVKKLYREFRRVAVPDLFLRWSHLCLVIEAKFFTDPSDEELREQVSLQREAIRKVQPYTLYKDWAIQHAILNLVGGASGNLDGTVVLSWDAIMRIIDKPGQQTQDIIYAKQMIQQARERALKELPPGAGITFERLKFDSLLTELPRLVRQGKVFIGFTGGIEALSTADENTLRNRSHYKVSDVRWSDNWLTIDQFLHRLFELRGYFDKYDAHGE